MGSPRNERVKSQLLHEVAVIVKDLKDPRIGFVTILDADLSPDLRHAKIFVSILGTPDEQKESFNALTHAAGFIRSKVGERIRLRYTPEIVFTMDDSLEYTDRIFKIMEDLKHAR